MNILSKPNTFFLARIKETNITMGGVKLIKGQLCKCCTFSTGSENTVYLYLKGSFIDLLDTIYIEPIREQEVAAK